MIDVVIPYIQAHNGEDLRYSIRSLQTNFPQLGRVWLVGERPHWYKGDYIPKSKIDNRWLDSTLKIWEAVPQLSENFVIWNDDFFLLKPAVFDDFANRGGEPLPNFLPNGYQQLLQNTFDLFENPKNYAYHYPLGVNKEKFIKLCDKYAFTKNVYSLINLYGNEYSVDGQVPNKKAVTQNKHFTHFENELREVNFVYTNSWPKGLKVYLERRFPEQSQVEVPVGKRPLPKIRQIQSLTTALFSAEEVPISILQERLETCLKCKYLKSDDKSKFCGLCGCSVSDDKNRIVNLAKYEENLPKWGCKHPERHNGYGWKN